MASGVPSARRVIFGRGNETMRYTHEQTAAITAPPGDTVIQALAGTAKTTVLASRIAYLIKRCKYEPQNIAAITYSTRAAESLLDKITQVVGDKCGPILGMPDLKVNTIHGYAMSLLKSVPHYRKYEVVDEATRRLLVRRHFRSLGIANIPRIPTRSPTHFNETTYLTPDPHDVGHLFLRTLDRAREEGLPENVLPPELNASYRAYRELLARECVWDYPQLLVALCQVLHDNNDPDSLALQKSLAETLKVIAVDEGQDCDPAMWAVLTRLRELGAHLFCVGDRNQTIFRFRSAAPDRLTRYGDETPGVRSHFLTKNFRASDGLVSVANGVITRFLGANEANLRMRHGSDHQHENGDIAAIRFASIEGQNVWGARRLKSLIGVAYRDRVENEPRSIAARDMAVLVRCRRQMPAVVSSLQAEGLEAVVRGSESLLVPDEAEMLATALDYLSGGRGAWDRKAGKVILSPVTEDAVRLSVKATGFTVDETSIQEGVMFLSDLRSSDEWTHPLCLIEVLERFLGSMGVAYSGEGGAGEQVRWQAVQRVLFAAVQFQRGWGFAKPLCEKLPHFARWLRIEAPMVSQEDNIGVNETLRLNPDAVSVMTIHASKGLEFAAVWMPDLAQSVLPLRYRPPEIWQVLPRNRLTPDQVRRVGGTAADHFLDEARLWYVGVTRAAKWFFATYAPPEGDKRPKPSPFFLHLEQHPTVIRSQVDFPVAVQQSAKQASSSTHGKVAPIQLTTTQLASYMACPRQFFLRFILGCPPPIQQEIGFGRGVHDAGWEVHRHFRAVSDHTLPPIHEIALRHFHLPYASETTKANLQKAAIHGLVAYVEDYRTRGAQETTLATEQEVRLDIDQLRVNGRIDLITEGTHGKTLVELKTARGGERDPEQMVPRTYSLGLQASTGALPDRVETRTICGGSVTDKTMCLTPEVVEETVRRIREVGSGIARGKFPALPIANAATCDSCDVRLVCAHTILPMR